MTAAMDERHISIFETVEIRHGAPVRIERHLELLHGAATRLGLPAPDADRIRDAVTDLGVRWGDEPGRLRITWSSTRDGRRDEQLLLVVAPGAPRRSPAHIATTATLVDPNGVTAGLKTGAYGTHVAALAAAPQATPQVDEVVLWTADGALCGGATSNVFIGRDGRLLTPGTDSGCRPGVTRALLLEALRSSDVPVSVGRVDGDDVARADEIFLVSTGRHVQPVASIDGIELPQCPGPLTARAGVALDTALGH